MTDLPLLFDPAPIVALQRFLGLGWPEPWLVITMLGTNWGIILVVGVAFWLWGRRVAYGLLAVVAVEAGLKMAVSWLFPVSRPDAPAVVKYEQVGVGSFPSGHVSTAAALWGWLAMRGRVAWGIALTIVVPVGISRMYLGVHYLVDVVGGLLLAAVALALAHWIWPPVRARLARRSFAFFATAAALAVALVIAGGFFLFGSNPYRWRAGGLVAGLALGLVLEYRFVRYEPGEASFGRKAAMVLVGGLVVAGLAAIDQVAGANAGILGLVLTAMAALWAVLVAPTLFVVLGWSRRPEPRRERVVRRTGWAVAAATLTLVAVVVYGGAIEPRLILDTEEHTAEIRRLPEAWEGATVAVVADFQVGLWLDNTGMLHRAVEAIVREDPDLVLLGGDFIYHPGQHPGIEVSHVLDILEPLIATGIPTFAVLGNHDWGAVRPIGEGAAPDSGAARMLRDSLEAAGIPLLHNRAVAVHRTRNRGADPDARETASGGAFYVVGVGSRYMDMDRPQEALAGVPDDAPRIVLFHNPDSFADFPAETAPLAVAGHTHGGQVRLPFTPGWSWLTYTEHDEVHADGWVERSFGKAGNRLYVTRGLGMSIIPMRINCPPELTLFTLARGTGGVS